MLNIFKKSLAILSLMLILLVMILPASVSAQGNPAGSTSSSPFGIKANEAVLVRPPTDELPGLTFTGLAISRYQPVESAPIDSTNDGHYTNQIEIENENEWAITLYNEDGELQMSDMDLGLGTDTQVFVLSASSSALQTLLFSSDVSLNEAVPAVTNNIRANNTVFRLQNDYLYRTQNNVEWRFTGDSFFFRIVDDSSAPDIRVLLNDTPSAYADNLIYDDPDNIFTLQAQDPDSESGGGSVSNSDLTEYRYQWFPNDLTNPSANTCANFWEAVEATGSANAWTTIPPENLITPDSDGFFTMTEFSFNDYVNKAPGSYSLCAQVKDEPGNVGSFQGMYVFVVADYVSLDCFNYQLALLNLCESQDCSQMQMADIAGFGRSSLSSTASGQVSNIGNTISCNVETNSHGGYELKVQSASSSADMVHVNPSYAPTNRFIPLTAAPNIRDDWPATLDNNSYWGLRIHSDSGTNIYSPSVWGTDDYSGGKWAGLATQGYQLYQRTENLNTSDPTHISPSAQDSAVIQLGAEAGSDSNLSTGKYHLELVFTATTLDP